MMQKIYADFQNQDTEGRVRLNTNVHVISLDTDFTGSLYLKNKFQSLVLNEQPTFKAGQQLTGYLTFTSSNWYEKSSGDNIDTNYIKGRLYFTCLTK